MSFLPSPSRLPPPSRTLRFVARDLVLGLAALACIAAFGAGVTLAAMIGGA